MFRAPRRSALLLVLATAATLLALPGAAQAMDRSGLGCSEALPEGVVAGPDWQQELEALVNAHRARLGRAPVRADARLVRAATWKARYQHGRAYREGVSEHDDIGVGTRPNRTPQERAETCGYTTGDVSENLAYSISAQTARSIFEGWLSSPGHRANIERPEWRFMGIGTALSATPNAFGIQNLWIAQLFGTRASATTPTCPSATVMGTWGRAVNVDQFLCRAAGSPVLLGAKPRYGRLSGMRYVPARRLGVVRFWVRWPDTGVRQRVDVWASGPPARVALGRHVCARGGRCAIAWTLVRPTVPTADTRMFVDRRVGRRWVRYRTVRLPARARRGVTRLVLRRGTYRVLVSVANLRAQPGASSPYRTIRVTR